MAGISTSGPSFLNPVTDIKKETAEERLDITREQFFKIMIAELQSQDPLEPMKNQDFLGQLAQLETLNSQTKMTAGIESLTSTMRFSHLNDASAMLGNIVTGTVRQQMIDDQGTPILDIEGQPRYEDVPVEGIAQRVVSENGDVSLLLLVPVTNDAGEIATDAQGNMITREVMVGIDTVREITSPFIGSEPVEAGAPSGGTNP
ncbi:MAG: hypothetical protein KDB07_12270 [Planctomycetes bacterium]|nr:hypothetical protein [Planctomycetota bacterium]